MGFLERFSSCRLHFFLIPLMVVSGHMEENPAHGIVIPAGGFAGGTFVYLQRCMDGACWDSSPPTLIVQKGRMSSQTMWTLYMSPPSGWTARDPRNLSWSSLFCKRKCGRNTDEDFDSLIPWSLGIITGSQEPSFLEKCPSLRLSSVPH